MSELSPNQISNSEFSKENTKKSSKRRSSAPTDETGTKSRLRHTNYFVTINTNQTCNEDSEEAPDMKERLRTAIRQVFNGNFIDKYVNLAPSAPKGSKLDNIWIKLDECEILWSLEIGPQYKKLHSHIIVTIPHYTLLRIDEQQLKIDLNKAMEECGYPSFHFKPVYGRSAGAGVEQLKDYIMKNPVS